MMKFFASVFVTLTLIISFCDTAMAGAKPQPSRGGEGIPWPLGDKASNDTWYFELAGDQYRVDIRKDRYLSGQWTYDVRLVNLTRKGTVGKGMGVYNENFYSFAVRDLEGRFYQFATLGQGSDFMMTLTIYNEHDQTVYSLKTTRSISY